MKSHDAANQRLVNKQFDIPISDVRTVIVYGTETEEARADDRLKTRFDFDYYFGTVTHRFCAQAVAGYPVTVYGKGSSASRSSVSRTSSRASPPRPRGPRRPTR